MYHVRIVFESVLAGLARRIVFLVLGAGAASAYYFTGAPEPEPEIVLTDSQSGPPLVRAVAMSTPPPSVARYRNESADAPAPSLGLPLTGEALVRELQTELARAGCYDGPVTGVWSSASVGAMRNFVNTVNATLPVGQPDETLLALIESNDTAACGPSRSVITGTIGERQQRRAGEKRAELHLDTGSVIDAPPAKSEVLPQQADPFDEPATSPIFIAPAAAATAAEDPSMGVSRSWVAPGMLEQSASAAPPMPPYAGSTAEPRGPTTGKMRSTFEPAAAQDVRAAAAEERVPQAAAAAASTPAPAATAPTPTTKSVVRERKEASAKPEFEPDVDYEGESKDKKSAAKKAANSKADKRKTKTAKKKPGSGGDDYDGVSDTLNSGIKTIQNSLSSIFQQ